MINESKLILFVVKSGNKLEMAYTNSFFRKTCRQVGIMWDNSFIGKLISSFFNIEAHKSTFTYRLIKSLSAFFDQKVIKNFPLKMAIENSKYISNIKKILDNMKHREVRKIKIVLSESFFIKSICEFWLSVD